MNKEKRQVCNKNFPMEEAINLTSVTQSCIKLGNFLYKISKLLNPQTVHLLDSCSDWAEEYYQILGYFENLILTKMNIDDDVTRDALADYIDDLIKNNNKEFYLDDIFNII